MVHRALYRHYEVSGSIWQINLSGNSYLSLKYPSVSWNLLPQFPHGYHTEPVLASLDPTLASVDLKPNHSLGRPARQVILGVLPIDQLVPIQPDLDAWNFPLDPYE